MSKINVKVRQGTAPQELPDLRKTNITLMKNTLSYLTQEEIQSLEDLIHKEVINKAYRLGISINYKDCHFIRLYNSNMRHMRLNLDQCSYIKNHKLAEKIKNHEVKLNDVIHMTPMELHKDRWSTYATTEEAEINVILKGGEGTMEHDTTLYRCGRCKGNNCAYRGEQSRSIDEGETHRVRCKDCGHRWNHFN